MIFNTNTGEFCIWPSQLDVTLIAILVNEFRNGILIGQVERDFSLLAVLGFRQLGVELVELFHPCVVVRCQFVELVN